MLKLTELEGRLRAAGVDGNPRKAEALAMAIARSAPTGAIANLAMHLMSAAVHLRTRREPMPSGEIDKLVAQLRSALQEAR